jgi:hypothetical protein
LLYPLSYEAGSLVTIYMEYVPASLVAALAYVVVAVAVAIVERPAAYWIRHQGSFKGNVVHQVRPLLARFQSHAAGSSCTALSPPACYSEAGRT